MSFNVIVAFNAALVYTFFLHNIVDN